MSKKPIKLGGFFKAPKKKPGYGLIKPGSGFGKTTAPKKQEPGMKKTLDLFKQATEEDQFDRGKTAVNRSLVSTGAIDRTQKMIDAAQAEALAQDPNAFDYDGVYDEIQKAREDAIEGHALTRTRSREKKQSKYIGAMLEQGKIKEMKEERIRERRLLKEREEEDHLFGDRDKYVTAAYKRKLEENKKWEEEDLRLEKLEAVDDVRKKGGTHHFLSNLLTKNTAFGADVGKNSTSAYTAGSGRVDEDGRVASEREVKRAKLEEEMAKGVLAKQAKETERVEMEQAKAELKEKRKQEAEVAAKQAVEDEKRTLLAKAEKAKADKKAKLEAIKAARARFAARKKENKNKPTPVAEEE
jgi:coiled-coil domain-containing protein 55